MNRLLARFALVGAFAAMVAALPQTRAAAEDYDTNYQTPGVWFGGVDTGVLIPLNALDRFTSVGGYIQPFVGYKFFQDKELQLNPGVVGSMQFFGLPVCESCARFNDNGVQLEDHPTYGLTYTIGPRVSVPWGPVELYGDWQVGGLTGLNSGSAITDTSWGFHTGGGINYFLNENVAIGAVGRWARFYQRVHGVGDVRYAKAGLELFLQQSPPPPPPPPVAPVAAPPPPPPPAKKKIVLRGVNFDFDKYNIRPDAVPILEQACSLLKQESNINVQCQGHTDSIGTEAYNQRLSERRANAVREWLIKCGISPSRLTAKGFGESNPVASNATPEGRAQNRRTELVVVGQ